MNCLMKGVIMAMSKGKLMAQVPFLLVDLAKPLLKVLPALVEGLILELCLDRPPLAK